MFGSMWTIAKREFKGMFCSPVAYVIIGVFAFLSGVHFSTSIDVLDSLLQSAAPSQNPQAIEDPRLNINFFVIQSVISNLLLILFLSVPILTMRAFAEERNNGTYELLLTSPVSTWSLVLGKFLAAGMMILCMFATHIVFLSVLFFFGDPEPLPVLSAYLGVFLMSMAFAAVGLFASSLTRYQILAIFIAVPINYFFLQLKDIASAADGRLGEVLANASLLPHLETLIRGVLTAPSLVYFFSLMAIFLVACQISIQSLARG